jgi:hypothetical protein
MAGLLRLFRSPGSIDQVKLFLGLRVDGDVELVLVAVLVHLLRLCFTLSLPTGSKKLCEFPFATVVSSSRRSASNAAQSRGSRFKQAFSGSRHGPPREGFLELSGQTAVC